MASVKDIDLGFFRDQSQVRLDAVVVATLAYFKESDAPIITIQDFFKLMSEICGPGALSPRDSAFLAAEVRDALKLQMWNGVIVHPDITKAAELRERKRIEVAVENTPKVQIDWEVSLKTLTKLLQEKQS